MKWCGGVSYFSPAIARCFKERFSLSHGVANVPRVGYLPKREM